MAFWQDFKAFALKGNVVDLAVAVVIGGAFGKIVSALVADIIMPLVGALMPSTEWRNWQATALHLKVGDFLGAVVDFFIVAMVLFIVVVKVAGRFRKAPPATT
jgi:large conductance mechanosensitive channel